MDTTNTEKLTIGFGYRRNIPDGVKALWGARLIYPADIVWNRTDMAGSEADKENLLGWLNDKVKTQPWDMAKALAGSYQMTQDSNEEYVLYEDDLGVVKGSPQKSFGYVYVVAYLKP